MQSCHQVFGGLGAEAKQCSYQRKKLRMRTEDKNLITKDEENHKLNLFVQVQNL